MTDFAKGNVEALSKLLSQLYILSKDSSNHRIIKEIGINNSLQES